MGICEHCNLDNCKWKTYREDIIRYQLECHQRNRPFGELGFVSDSNLHARKVLCIKYSQLVNLPIDTPCPTCVVVGLSFCFQSKKFQDGTALPNFLRNSQRDGQQPKKKKRITSSICNCACFTEIMNFKWCLIIGQYIFFKYAYCVPI